MNLQTDYCTKSKLQFSLKNATRDFSLIRVRMTINGVRFTYYLSDRIKTSFWDKTNGCAIEDVKRNPALKNNPTLQTILRNINREIDKTTNCLIYVVEDFKSKEVHPTNAQIRAELDKQLRRKKKCVAKAEATKEQRTFKDFLSFIDFYIDQCKKGFLLNSKGLRLSSGTIRSYEMAKVILKKYTSDRHKKLTFESIDMDFYNDFVEYLNSAEHQRGKYKPNVIGKFIKQVKTFMRYAYDNNYTQNRDFEKKGFKVFREDVETIYLNEDELEALYNLELPNGEANVRDAFLISCYTGMRYSDVDRLDVSNHIDFENNIITIITQKTTKKVIIPMNSIVRNILKRHDSKTPLTQSNQATNRVLKNICEQAGINTPVAIMETSGGVRQENIYPKYKLVTSHTARRSFATNAFKRNVPTLSIMQITGHRTETSFMRYIRIGKEENAKNLQGHEFFK